MESITSLETLYTDHASSQENATRIGMLWRPTEQKLAKFKSDIRAHCQSDALRLPQFPSDTFWEHVKSVVEKQASVLYEYTIVGNSANASTEAAHAIWSWIVDHDMVKNKQGYHVFKKGTPHHHCWLLGVLVGQSLTTNMRSGPLTLSLAWYKRMLGWQWSVRDICDEYPELGQRLMDISQDNGLDFETRHRLTFIHPIQDSDECIRLVDNGELIPVTLDNKMAYIDLVVSVIMMEPMMNVFCEGFHYAAAVESLLSFRPEELKKCIQE